MRSLVIAVGYLFVLLIFFLLQLYDLFFWLLCTKGQETYSNEVVEHFSDVSDFCQKNLIDSFFLLITSSHDCLAYLEINYCYGVLMILYASLNRPIFRFKAREN